MSLKKQIGDCEVCDQINVEVTKETGNIVMCASCAEKQRKAYEQDKAAKILIGEFRQNSSSVLLKQDVFNAKTIAAIELRGAIEQNTDIPDSDKEAAFTEECKTHVLHFKQVVFDLQTSLADAQNSLAMWQTQGQMSAGKLRAEARKGYELFDVNYRPEPVKKIKPATVPTPRKSAKTQNSEAREAAAKYGLDYHIVHMIATQEGISAMDAAKKTAEARDNFKAKTAGKV